MSETAGEAIASQLLKAGRDVAALEDLLLDYIANDCGDCTARGDDVRSRLWKQIRSTPGALDEEAKLEIIQAEAEKYRS